MRQSCFEASCSALGLRRFCSPLQVNAAFDSHVDECDVVGFMHALGYASFASEGEQILDFRLTSARGCAAFHGLPHMCIGCLCC